LRELDAIPQREFHRISRELIQIGDHIYGGIAERVRINKYFCAGGDSQTSYDFPRLGRLMCGRPPAFRKMA
jgi:hypothetical protein